MKVFFTVAASLVFAGWVHAQPSNAAANAIGPRITFSTENYDFGKILTGETVKHTFYVTNTGDAPLDITSAHGTCSCTVVGNGPDHGQWAPQHLAPGQGCPLPVEVATLSYGGQTINKQVIVASNDPKRPMATLQIHGAVWEPIQVMPSVAFFNVAANTATNSTQVIKIYNRTDDPITLSDPVCTTNAFSFVLTTNVPGKEFQLNVIAAPVSQWPPASGAQAVQGTISIKTSVPVRNPLTISVYETVLPEVTVYPAMIQVPHGPLPRALTNHITIRDDTADLSLSHPSANYPAIVTSVTMVQTNRRYSLDAIFPEGFVMPDDQSVTLTVNSDNPRFPILTIPVTAMKPLVPNRPQVPPPMRTAVLPGSIRANPPGATQ